MGRRCDPSRIAARPPTETPPPHPGVVINTTLTASAERLADSSLAASAERIAQRTTSAVTGAAATTTAATSEALEVAADALTQAREDVDAGERRAMMWATAGVVALTGVALTVRAIRRRRRRRDDVVVDERDPHVQRFETLDEGETGYRSTGEVTGWELPSDELTERRN